MSPPASAAENPWQRPVLPFQTIPALKKGFKTEKGGVAPAFPYCRYALRA
jgi:hypothetical protein